MKILLRSLGLNTQVAWSGQVQERLNCLQKLTTIESARVTLERHREEAPSFRVQVVLAVPGPDYHADAADFTLAAALRKAVGSLKRQILARRNKRRVQGKSNLQLGTISRRWANAFAGHRA